MYNFLELMQAMMRQAREDGTEARLARSMALLAEKVGLTEDEIAEALEPQMVAGYPMLPVVYYP